MSAENSDAESPIDVDDALAGARVTVEDGDPMIELPTGDCIRLGIHVREWTHEEPLHGEPVAMNTELESDDHAWWILTPDREGMAVPTDNQRFPRVQIVPEHVDGEDRDSAAYVLTDAEGAPISGEWYDDADRATDARARLMADHPDGDQVTVEEVRDL